jgi:hypothetical protein
MQLVWTVVSTVPQESYYRNLCFSRAGLQSFTITWLPFGFRLYSCFNQ